MQQSEREALPESLQRLLDQANKLSAMQRAQGFEYTPIGMRESLDLMTRRFVTNVPDLAWVRDTLVQGLEGADYPVPVRVYQPRPDQALPVLVFAHGGGHMAGGVSVYDAIARKLAIASQRVLVSVEYRLAPECPYPLGLVDLKHVIRNVFPTLQRLGVAHLPQLAVAGDSGGGAIAASAVHQLAAEPGVRIDHQVLIYSSLDYTMSLPSMDACGKGYLLERDRIAWLFGQYLRQGEDRRRVSPLFMALPDHYPKTLLVTAEYCPLRDESLAYADRLAHAGHPVEHLHFPNMIHAFLNLEDLVADVCAEFYRTFGKFLADA